MDTLTEVIIIHRCELVPIICYAYFLLFACNFLENKYLCCIIDYAHPMDVKFIGYTDHILVLHSCLNYILAWQLARSEITTYYNMIFIYHLCRKAKVITKGSYPENSQDMIGCMKFGQF